MSPEPCLSLLEVEILGGFSINIYSKTIIYGLAYDILRAVYSLVYRLVYSL